MPTQSFDDLLNEVTSQMLDELFPPRTRDTENVAYFSEGEGADSILDRPDVAKRLLESLITSQESGPWELPRDTQPPGPRHRLRLGECIVWYTREAICADSKVFRMDRTALRAHLDTFVKGLTGYAVATHGVSGATITAFSFQVLKSASRIGTSAFCAWVTDLIDVKGIEIPPLPHSA